MVCTSVEKNAMVILTDYEKSETQRIKVITVSLLAIATGRTACTRWVKILAQ